MEDGRTRGAAFLCEGERCCLCLVFERRQKFACFHSKYSTRIDTSVLCTYIVKLIFENDTTTTTTTILHYFFLITVKLQVDNPPVLWIAMLSELYDFILISNIIFGVPLVKPSFSMSGLIIISNTPTLEMRKI